MDLLDQNALLSAMEWTESTQWYKGDGRAGMEDPRAILSGDASVHLNHLGHIFIDLDPRQSQQLDPASEPGLFDLLATSPDPNNTRKRLIGLQWPSCAQLTIATPTGEFRTSNPRLTRLPLDAIGGSPPYSEPFPFRALRGEFHAGGSKPPHYWLLPLSNLVVEFVHECPELVEHPLRLVDKTRRSRVIPFEFQGRPAFIQPLPDAEERVGRLQNGRACSLVTATMIGELGSNPPNSEGIRSWFPFDLLPILGLASGQEVGAPWLEFRADDGSLVSRFHNPYSGWSYSPGRPGIHEGICGTTGDLLTCALRAADFGKPYLRVAINHLVRANRRDRTIDGILNSLCIALETLMKHHGIKSVNLLDALDAPHREEVLSILRDASSRIRDLANSAATSSQNPEQRDSLHRISQKVPSAAVQEEKFGQGVVKLLDKFGLEDAKVLRGHFQQNPHPDGKDWPALLSYYRGSVAHEGYITISRADHVLDEVANLGRHLRDTLLRMLLKTLGYQGLYQPATLSAMDRQALDWVTPATEPRALGYV